MFLNTFASTEDQLFQGKYNNKVPPKTDRQGPLESLNGSYDKSSRVRLSKPQHNKYGHIHVRLFSNCNVRLFTIVMSMSDYSQVITLHLK